MCPSILPASHNIFCSQLIPIHVSHFYCDLPKLQNKSHLHEDFEATRHLIQSLRKPVSSRVSCEQWRTAPIALDCWQHGSIRAAVSESRCRFCCSRHHGHHGSEWQIFYHRCACLQSTLSFAASRRAITLRDKKQRGGMLSHPTHILACLLAFWTRGCTNATRDTCIRNAV